MHLSQKLRANSAKIKPFSESAHLIYPKSVEISLAKICVLTSEFIIPGKSWYRKALVNMWSSVVGEVDAILVNFVNQCDNTVFC